MKILLLYPEVMNTFFTFKEVLKFLPQKAYFPPLGLLTVAGMLPAHWTLKLVDMNVTSLTDDEIKSADYVFVSAMVVQRKSVRQVIDRCKELNAKIVAGGPLFTTYYEDYDDVDYLVLGEAEATLPLFLSDVENGCAKHLYLPEDMPDLRLSPTPLWSLINLSDYVTMPIQTSRGCPFDCEFCDVVVLNGHKPRMKSKEQVIKELDILYEKGWRSNIFIVDDNFVGNKQKVKTETLPALISWSNQKKFRFWFNAQVSINLADDEELMHLMHTAGFFKVFVGIETVNEESLSECGKTQNLRRNLVETVKLLHKHGLEVQGGFIVGFDSDPTSIFQEQVDFIQDSGIVTATVSLLGAARGTKLYKRLKAENRLLTEWSGDNTDCSLNFVPRMDFDTLINGYKYILSTINSPKYFYTRLRTFLKEYQLQTSITSARGFPNIVYICRDLIKNIKVIIFLGISNSGRADFWKLYISTLIKHPRSLPVMVNLSIFGFHFNQLTRKLCAQQS